MRRGTSAKTSQILRPVAYFIAIRMGYYFPVALAMAVLASLHVSNPVDGGSSDKGFNRVSGHISSYLF